MFHLMSKPPLPDVGKGPPPLSPIRHAESPVLISEQQVLFATAAATFVPPAATRHHHWPRKASFARVLHIHIALPEPRPRYPRREASYFERSRLSREMGHL